jgi:cell division protein FtsL
MIRIATFTIGCALLALGSGWHMFAVKYDIRQLDRQIDKVAAQIRDTRGQAADLHSEYEALSDVGRLKGLAEQVLDLRPSQAAQTLPYTEFDRRLPPVGVPPDAEPMPPVIVAQPAPAAVPLPVPQVVASAAAVPVPVPLPAPAPIPVSVPQVPRPAPHPPAPPVAAAIVPAQPVPQPRPPAPLAATPLASAPRPRPEPQLPTLPTLPVDTLARFGRGPADSVVPAVTSALGMARSMLGTSQPGRR